MESCEKMREQENSKSRRKAFIAKVQADTSLQGQLNGEGADVVAVAKVTGFSITAETPRTDDIEFIFWSIYCSA